MEKINPRMIHCLQESTHCICDQSSPVEDQEGTDFVLEVWGLLSCFRSTVVVAAELATRGNIYSQLQNLVLLVVDNLKHKMNSQYIKG